MAINLIIAIVRESQTKPIVSKLYENNIPGVTISTVRGYGEQVNAYSQDITQENTRIEIFVAEKYTDHIVDIIMETAHTGMEGDGVLAVIPVTTMYQIRDGSQLKDQQLMPGSNESDAAT